MKLLDELISSPLLLESVVWLSPSLIGILVLSIPRLVKIEDSVSFWTIASFTCAGLVLPFHSQELSEVIGNGVKGAAVASNIHYYRAVTKGDLLQARSRQDEALPERFLEEGAFGLETTTTETAMMVNLKLGHKHIVLIPATVTLFFVLNMALSSMVGDGDNDKGLRIMVPWICVPLAIAIVSLLARFGEGLRDYYTSSKQIFLNHYSYIERKCKAFVQA